MKKKTKTKTQGTGISNAGSKITVSDMAEHNRQLHAIGESMSESPCARIRRLATEEDEHAKAIVRQSKREFVQRICGDVPFTEDQGVFTICGYEWMVGGSVTHYLWCASAYNGIDLDPHCGVAKPSDLGHALLKLDKRLNELKAQYPDARWGNFKKRLNNIVRSIMASPL